MNKNSERIKQYVRVAAVILLIAIIVCFILAKNQRMEYRLNKGARKYNFTIDSMVLVRDSIMNDSNFYDVYIESPDFYMLSKEDRVSFFIELDQFVGKRFYMVDIKSGEEEYLDDGRTSIEIAEDNREKEEKEAAELQKEIDDKKDEYELDREISEEEADDLPYLGMSESLLSSTRLGKPNEIKPCLNYNHLDKDHKSKEYSWVHVDDEHISEYHVTVWYRWHYGRGVDEYIDLSDNNGYVESLWMMKDGKMKSKSYTKEKYKKK